MSRKESLMALQAKERTQKLILGNQLKELRLTAFIDEYEELAQDATRANWSYEKYLTDLTNLEVERRHRNRRQRRITKTVSPDFLTKPCVISSSF